MGKVQLNSTNGSVTLIPQDGSGNVNVIVPRNGLAAKVASSTDNAIVRFDGTTGEVQNSGVIIDDNNNINITGTGARITGDFSNATASNRVAFQTSTLNGATSPFFIPNGTGTKSQVVAGASSDASNSSYISIMADSSTGLTSLNSGANGTGTFLPMIFTTNGSERMRIETNGDVKLTTSPAQFDNDTSIATTEFVQRALGNYYYSYSQSTSTTLLAADAGKICNAFNTITLTLPLAANIIVGSTYKINNAGAGTITINANTGDSLYAIGNGTPRSFTLKRGDELTISYVGGNSWYAWGSAQLGFATGIFDASLAANGYQKLPSGLILQWGITTNGTSGTETFPIAFPNACFGVQVTNSSTNNGTFVSSFSATTFSWSNLQTVTNRYLTIGY